jgi:hypothetical protein
MYVSWQRSIAGEMSRVIARYVGAMAESCTRASAPARARRLAASFDRLAARRRGSPCNRRR